MFEKEDKNEQLIDWQQSSNSYYSDNSGSNSKLAQMVIRNSGGLVRTEKQANGILIISIILIVIITLSLGFGGSSNSNPDDINVIPAEN